MYLMLALTRNPLSRFKILGIDLILNLATGKLNSTDQLTQFRENLLHALDRLLLRKVLDRGSRCFRAERRLPDDGS